MLSWIPWRVRIRIGPPLSPETLFGDERDDADERVLRAALLRVEQAVEQLMRER
jgi:hypothetical protein